MIHYGGGGVDGSGSSDGSVSSRLATGTQTRFTHVMRFPLIVPLLLLAVTTTLAQTLAPAPIPAQTNKPNAFEKEILAFEASDHTNPPPRHAVLFVGSSSIRLWKTLAQDFPNRHIINRGFGGSQIADSILFADRIVLPYEPATIVFYAGGNDLNAGKTPQAVFNDYKTFVAQVREKLPDTKIAYISIAGNPARWSQIDRVREANQLIREFSRTLPGLSYIDTATAMLGANGLPRPEIFVADKLHMNTNGYAIWTRVIGAHLQQMDAGKKP